MKFKISQAEFNEADTARVAARVAARVVQKRPELLPVQGKIVRAVDEAFRASADRGYNGRDSLATVQSGRFLVRANWLVGGSYAVTASVFDTLLS